MARSDVIRADLERIRGMSEAEFEADWGEWARGLDKDLHLVRTRWIADLERALPYAEAEDELVAELVAAKDACREDPSEENKARKAAAVEAVRACHAEERAGKQRQRIGGDAFVAGV